MGASRTLFIGDLHLDAARIGTRALSIRFFEHAEGANALFILGDFVEYWLGDDIGAPSLSPVFDSLRALSKTGTAIHLMHGNRDFLLGDSFATDIGATLHREDVIEIQLAGERLLLLHGDTLCTDDVDYQQLRLLLRSDPWQRQFLELTPEERIAEAQKLRDASKEALSEKNATITDVNAQAVSSLFTSSGCKTIIHGHTHRPADHELRLNGDYHRRMVVGDWHADHAQYVEFDGTDFSLKTFR